MADIHLYSLATPNGQKVSCFLEAANIPYEASKIDILKNDQFTDDYIKINPNSKIPAIVDKKGTNGEEHAIMESGAILLYLAEKYDQFLPKDPVQKSQCIQWLFFQMASVGPMFGQFGHFFKYAGEKCDHPYPTERYSNEVKRLLKVIENQLQDNAFLLGKEACIADFAIVPWILCLDKFYNAEEQLSLNEFKKIKSYQNNFLEIPGVKKGLEVCAF